MPTEILTAIPEVRGSDQKLFMLSHSLDNPAQLSVNERIRYARLFSRLKSREVAERAGIAITTYCRYERGEITDEGMDYHILERIAEVCGFPKDFCLDEYQKFRPRSAEIIRKYMLDNSITNAELSQLTGVSLTSVKQWKSGKCSPSHKLWENLFKAISI